MTDLQVVSLFAGIGGIDRGLELAGANTALLCELDKHARAILARHYPNAAIHNDVTELTADDCRNAGAVPERTILTAGFPCQDLSVAGRRRGMGQGTRSGLYWHVDRLLAEFRPAWVILENVPGLLSAACPCPGDGTCAGTCPGELHAVPGGVCEGGCVNVHGGTMGAVLGSLAERGYGFAYRVLDARHFGVPQRRRRVVIVGHLGDTGAAPAQVLLEPEGVRGDSAQGITPRPFTARDAGAGTSGRGPDGRGETYGSYVTDGTPTLPRSQTLAVAYTPDVANSLMAHGGNDKHDPTMMTYVAQEVSTLTAAGGERGYRVDAETAAGGHQVAASSSLFRKAQKAHGPDDCERWQEDELADTLDASGHAARTAHAVVTPLAIRGRDDGAELEFGDPDGPYNALRAGDGGSSRSQLVQIETEVDVIVRRLTPMECERLQGYPDNWTEGQADSHRYKQLGNSVAVPVFEWVGRRLVAVDNQLLATA